jgi:hypothetical protein
MADAHLKVMQEVVERSVRISQSDDEEPIHTCLTCSADATALEGIPHLDNCPVGDLQRAILDAGGVNMERNIRLANRQLNLAIDNIHELVRNGAPADKIACIAIINTVHEITKVFTEGT